MEEEPGQVIEARKEPIMEEKRSLSGVLLSSFVILLILAAGVISGRSLSYRQSGKGIISPTEVGERIEKKMVIGVENSDVFRDTAVGIVEENDGSFTNEGTHKLIREGGESQTVYLTSSVLDLGKLLGRKVKIWGETFTAQKAGWLMDVGKVEVLE